VVSLINAQVLPDSRSNFSGMAPGSSVMVMRGLKESSARITEPQQPTAEAITAAVKAGAEIINISQAGSDDTGLADAVAKAIDQGVIVVASSGNEGKAGPRYPAAYPGVISVGMTTTSDAAHESSEQGVGVDVTVAAPGDAVVGLLPSDPKNVTDRTSKVFLSSSQVWNTELGTSFAAPIVTGVVALMLQKAKAEGVRLTPAEVKRRLQVSADPPPGAVPDAQLGYGIVNPMRAVFGPFPDTAATPAPRASAPAGPLVIPPERDTSGMLVAVVVTLGVLVLLFGALLIREALGPMRARMYAPARPDE
jgi:subtilisin family serine protease